MGLLDRLAIRHYPTALNGNGKSAPAPPELKQQPAATVPIPQFPFWVIDDEGRVIREITDGGGDTGPGAYIASVLVHAAVSYRMQKLVEAPLMVVREDDSGESWVDGHELDRILEQPNPDQEMEDLLEETHLHMDLTGRSLWVKSRDRLGRVGELRAFSGDEFRVEAVRRVTAEEERKGMRPRLFGRFYIDSLGSEPFYPEDVVFFKYPHPTDRSAGISPVRAVGRMLGISAALEGHVRRALEHGAQIGGSFKVPADRPLEEAEYQRLDAIIRARYSGGNSYRPFLAEGGLEFQPMAHSFKDLALGELWREVEAAVCTAFRVRPEVLGMLVGLENSPWSHMSTAQRLSYEEAIIPLWTRHERTLTRQLLREVDEDPKHMMRFDRSRIPALQDDLEQKANILTKVGGDMTRDERRQFMGFQSLTPAQRREMEEERAAPDEPAPPAEPEEAEAEAKRGLVSLVGKQVSERSLSDILYEEIANPLEINLWLAVQSLLRGDALTVEEIFRAGLEYGMLTASLAASFERQVNAAFTPTGSVGLRWRSVVRPHLMETARAGVDRLPPNLQGAAPMTPAELARVADGEATFLVRSVTETSREEVRKAISDALQERASVSELVEQVGGMRTFGEERARLIAQTEVTRVVSGAGYEAVGKIARDVGLEVYGVWNTQRDDRVRPAHEAQDLARRQYGEPFPNGVLYPSEPGCRCYLTWETEP